MKSPKREEGVGNDVSLARGQKGGLLFCGAEFSVWVHASFLSLSCSSTLLPFGYNTDICPQRSSDICVKFLVGLDTSVVVLGSGAA